MESLRCLVEGVCGGADMTTVTSQSLHIHDIGGDDLSSRVIRDGRKAGDGGGNQEASQIQFHGSHQYRGTSNNSSDNSPVRGANTMSKSALSGYYPGGTRSVPASSSAALRNSSRNTLMNTIRGCGWTRISRDSSSSNAIDGTGGGGTSAGVLTRSAANMYITNHGEGGVGSQFNDSSVNSSLSGSVSGADVAQAEAGREGEVGTDHPSNEELTMRIYGSSGSGANAGYDTLPDASSNAGTVGVAGGNNAGSAASDTSSLESFGGGAAGLERKPRASSDASIIQFSMLHESAGGGLAVVGQRSADSGNELMPGFDFGGLSDSDLFLDFEI